MRALPLRTVFPVVVALLVYGPATVVAEPVAAPPVPEGTLLGTAPPMLEYATAAALLDVTTTTFLYGRDASRRWAPASLTKLVTIYTALDAADGGEVDFRAPQPVHPNAYASAVPPGSSLMFLGPGQVVGGVDLLRGLVVSSGNDAAVEVAMRVSGSVGAFNARMNEVAHRLGFDQFYFEDPAGLSAANRITAAGISLFAVDLIERWPWLLDEVFSLTEFTYPQPRNYPDGWPGGAIRQFNRNGLVGSFDGADGLKTGFIEESGYNIVATAERGGRRLVAVILGVQADSHQEGSRRRDADAAALLEWGFRSYEVVTVGAPQPDPVRVWGTRTDEVMPVVAELPPISVPAGTVGRITGSIEQDRDRWAPLSAGDTVGQVRYSLDGTVLEEVPLTIPEDVPEGSAIRRLFDRVRWWLAGFFGDRPSAA